MSGKIKYSFVGKRIEPYPIALALFFIFSIFYVVCISIKLILTGFGIEGLWHMHKLWSLILPGFTGMDTLSLILGLFEVSVGSYLIAYTIIPVYNYFIKHKSSEKKPEVKPVMIRFKALFISLAVYVSVLFSLCLLYDLVVPPDYQMLNFWELLLPGFKGLNLISYITGIAAIIIYSAYISFIFSKTMNYFERIEIKRIENNNLRNDNSIKEGVIR